MGNVSRRCAEFSVAIEDEPEIHPSQRPLSHHPSVRSRRRRQPTKSPPDESKSPRAYHDMDPSLHLFIKQQPPSHHHQQLKQERKQQQYDIIVKQRMEGQLYDMDMGISQQYYYQSAPGSGSHTPNPYAATWSYASSPYLQQRSLQDKEMYLSPARLIPTTYIPRKTSSGQDSDLGGDLSDECPRCAVIISHEECMCKKCWDSGGEEMRQVVRHHNHNHANCPEVYPESQIAFLPNQDELAIAHWRAEWRHAHDDHQLCRPEYMFGCTDIEKQQLLQVRQHMAGSHSSCPPDYPEYQLKADLTGTGQYEAEELSEPNKRIWRAIWKHQHHDHTTCTAEYGYGCAGVVYERQRVQTRSASPQPHISQSAITVNGVTAVNGTRLIPPPVIMNGHSHSHPSSSTVVPPIVLHALHDSHTMDSPISDASSSP